MNKQKLIKQVIGPKYQLEYLKDIGTNATIIRLTNRLTQKTEQNVYSANQSATSQFSFERMANLVRGIEHD